MLCRGIIVLLLEIFEMKVQRVFKILLFRKLEKLAHAVNTVFIWQNVIEAYAVFSLYVYEIVLKVIQSIDWRLSSSVIDFLRYNVKRLT
jgi:hypothetical protein